MRTCFRALPFVLGLAALACTPGQSSSAVPESGTPGSGSSSSGGTLPAPEPSGPAPSASYKAGVSVRLERVTEGGAAVSFGLPLPRGLVVDPTKVRVRAGGAPVESGVRVKAILSEYDRSGKAKGPRALLVQLPASVMTKPTVDVEIAWAGTGGAAPASDVAPYAQIKHESPVVVDVADRVIAQKGGSYELAVKKKSTKTLFTGWEPNVLAMYPAGYLAETGIVGEVISRDELFKNPRFAGLRYLSDNLRSFLDGASYDEGYPVKPESVVDPVASFEGWLYDRCATFLVAYAHLGEKAKLRQALRSCSYYGSKIRRTGPDAGTFSGKPEPDSKYSHLRGLYAYYALTGDEEALTAGKLIADAWLADSFFSTHYRKGAVRGKDKLWTERLLAVNLEVMAYGYLLLGDPKYLAALRELVDTAYKHVTTKDPKELEAIIKVVFPPQDCFIHSAEQHGENDAQYPWCSGWMSELLVDPLLRYQELTGDPRADEIFVRLARGLRDNGTNYFLGNPQEDTFLQPKVCFDPSVDDPRMLVPLYGFGLYPDKKRKTFSDWNDFEHCADATALTAAAIRGLKRLGKFDAPGVGPFKTEGESFVAMHDELSYCAKRAFGMWTRDARDPRKVKGAALAEGWSGGNEKLQGEWLEKQKIGYPVHETSPTRKLSWWFNGSMSQFRLLDEAGVGFPTLRPGYIQGPGCKPVPRK